VNDDLFCITREEADELNKELIEKDNMDNKLEWSLWTQVITVVLVMLGIAI
jgi:hypothetical protein